MDCRHLALAVAGVVLLLCPAAHGNSTYSFATDQALYTALPGETVTVNVYLMETTTSGGSRLVDEWGLSSAQVTIQRSVEPPIAPAWISGYTANTAEFSDLISPWENQFLPSVLDLTQFVDIFAPSGPTGVGSGGVRSVWLLDANILVGAAVGETTTFTVEDNPFFDETLTFLGLDPLDPEIASTEFSVTAVPEPMTVVATSMGLISLGVELLHRRRRCNPC